MSCLIIKNDGLGDLVLASGIISDLIAHHGGQVDLVTCEQNAEIASMIPGLRRVFLVSRDQLRFGRTLWKLGVLRRRSEEPDSTVLRQIASEIYDVAICLRRYIRESSLVLMHAVNAKAKYCAWQFPTNVGFDLAQRASAGWTRIEGPQTLLWEPGYYAAALASGLGLEVSPTPRLLVPLAAAAGPVPERSVALGIGGSTAQWPESAWSALVQSLVEGGWSVGLFAGEDAAPVAARLSAAHGCTNWVGKLNFKQTAAHLAGYRAYIGYDTGLSHFATLVARKVLVILGGGTFRRFFPWKDTPHQSVIFHGLDCFDCTWDCPFAEKHCLTRVGAADVYRAFLDLDSGRLAPEVDLNPQKVTYQARGPHGPTGLLTREG